MQNQVNTHPERTNPVSNAVTLTSPFVLTPGEVLNLTSLVSSANAKTTSGKVLCDLEWESLEKSS